MLGTLTDAQKANWKQYVPSLVHAYNATKHESTTFTPFFLMFGRHPRLAIDAYLGIDPNDHDGKGPKTVFASELRKRLNYAYELASAEANKSSRRYKAQYDSKVRDSTLKVGDRVLVRNVGLKGKQKLANRWESSPYVVISQPNPEIPVYKLRQEDGRKVRTLHRNMLLPFDFLSKACPPASPQLTTRPSLNAVSSDTDESVTDSSESEPSPPRTRSVARRARSPPRSPGTTPHDPPVPRRGTRTRRPPQWF